MIIDTKALRDKVDGNSVDEAARIDRAYKDDAYAIKRLTQSEAKYMELYDLIEGIERLAHDLLDIPFDDGILNEKD